MISLLAKFLFFLLIGLIWVFNISWLHSLFVAGIAALVLAVIYFLALIGRPIQ